MDINAATRFLRGSSPRSAAATALSPLSTARRQSPSPSARGGDGEDEDSFVFEGDEEKQRSAPTLVSYSTRKAERLLNILLETLPTKRIQQLKLKPNLKETVRWILHDILKTNQHIATLLRRTPLDERALFAALRKALVLWIQERARAIKVKYMSGTNHTSSSGSPAAATARPRPASASTTATPTTATTTATTTRSQPTTPTRRPGSGGGVPNHTGNDSRNKPPLMRRLSALTPEVEYKKTIRAAERMMLHRPVGGIDTSRNANTNRSPVNGRRFPPGTGMAHSPQAAAIRRDFSASVQSPQVGRNAAALAEARRRTAAAATAATTTTTTTTKWEIPQRTVGSMQMVPGADRSYVSEYTLFEKRAARRSNDLLRGMPRSPTSSPLKQQQQQQQPPPPSPQQHHQPRVVHIPGRGDDTADGQGLPHVVSVVDDKKRGFALPDLPRLHTNSKHEVVGGTRWSIATADDPHGAAHRASASGGGGGKPSALVVTHEVGSLEWPEIEDDEDGVEPGADSDQHRAALSPLPASSNAIFSLSLIHI